MDAKEQVVAFIRREQLLPPDCAVIVGVSGGADSVTLLHLLCALRQDGVLSHLEVVHVNHCLRGDESLRDQRFVEELCKQWDVPFSVVSYDVKRLAQEQGRGVEEVGRELRYAAFEQVADRYPVSRIATAHTADDNAETLLLHLCRGSGLHGASGIPPKRDRIIRPLLCCTRQDVETYCAENGLSYVTDSTNADVQYARNRVRLEVMPSLRTINPQVTAAMTRFIEQARGTDALLNELTDQAIEQVCTEQANVYDRVALLQLSAVLRTRVLYRLTQTAEERHVHMLDSALQEGSGAVTLPTGTCWSVTSSHLVRLADATPYFSFMVTDGKWYEIGENAYRVEHLSREEYEQKLNISKRVFSNALDCDKICGDLVLRQRADGDRFHPVGRGCGKSLKQLFNEKKTHNRDAVPVLCDQNGIVAVYGFGCDERVRITHETKTVLRIVKRGEDV